jgi:hypothetical protein
MRIPTDEYEQRRHVFDMCRWINQTLTKMESESDFDRTYFERKGLNVKQFIEEAIPIACLGLHFYRPPDDVYVKCLAGNEPYDAELEVSGFRSIRIKVEATTIETNDSTLRRQSLSRHGFAYSFGPIRKDDEQIVSEPEMADLTAEYEQWTNLAFERYLLKVAKSDRNTAIVVYLDTPLRLPVDARSNLLRRTREHLSNQRPKVYGVYYCYKSDYVIDGIRSSDVE